MILITGGLGYLGIRISEHLLALGYKIRLATSRENPNIPESVTSCECIKIDFNDRESLENACYGVDEIIHLAALDAFSSQENPELALFINGLGTLKLLNIAEALPIKKFIYMSTVHVYGSPLKGMIEETSLTKPLHPYSITHRLAEDYVTAAHNRNKLSAVIFRLSNVVGSPSSNSGNAWNLVVNDLCKQVIVDKKMQLHSSETLQRDFLPMSTVVRAVGHSLVNSNYSGEIFNLSSGSSLTLRELTELISKSTFKLLGFTPSVHFNTSNGKDQTNQKLLISNMKIKNTGFKVESNISNEIDKILLNCSSWFN